LYDNVLSLDTEKWFEDYPDYKWQQVANSMMEAAEYLDIPLEWGYAKWGWDKPHYQLPWSVYKK